MTSPPGCSSYLALFVTFVLIPIVYGLWISLHSWDFMLPDKPFIGLDNYISLMSPDSVNFSPFWQSMQASAIFTVASVPLLLVVPLAVALVMNANFRGRNVVRAIYFAPYVLGVAVVGVVWRFVLDTNVGALNWLLGALGLPDNIAWLSSLPAAWVALVGVTVWWTLGFNAVIFLAGLQDIPKELYEAAKVDGASKWQAFRNVTLPGLRQVTAFVTMITIIASANMFGQSYVMTSGAPGPENKTLQAGLATLQAANSVRYDLLMAAAVIASVPVLLLFVIAQRYVIEGVSRSGVKG